MTLQDETILGLCRDRDPLALEAMGEKYGAYCYTVAYHVLGDHHDAEECVNDAYLAVWNAIPQSRPGNLLAYLARTTRNLALKRLEHDRAKKRDGGFLLVLEELAEVLPARETLEEAVSERLLTETIGEYLRHKASRTERNMFLRRYFWGDSIAELAARFDYSESKTRSILYRTRKKLRAYLEKKGVLEP